MAKLIAVCRDEEFPFERRQIPLMIEETLTMVMEIPETVISTECVVEGDVKQFIERYDLLTFEELNCALMVSQKELFALLALSVPCVGCRRSVERLYGQLLESGQPALEPLIIKTSRVLTLSDGFLSDPRLIYALFYIHGSHLNDMVDTIPKSRRNRRCILHSLETHKTRSLGWMDVWDLLSQECRDEVVLIDSDALLETLENYLRKHRFCSECKSKVLKAYNILTGDIEGEAEKGYCATLYEGLKSCPKERHVHVLCDTDFIAHLIDSAEPELTGGRRERHARTIEIAQGEIDCQEASTGTVFSSKAEIWNQLALFTEVSMYTSTEYFLNALDYILYSSLYEKMAVEDKQGISRLEQVVEEISEAERMKELRKEQKRLKKKKRKENRCKFASDAEKRGKIAESDTEKENVGENGQESENEPKIIQENGKCERSEAVACSEEKPNFEITKPILNGIHENTTDESCPGNEAVVNTCQGIAPVAENCQGKSSEEGVGSNETSHVETSSKDNGNGTTSVMCNSKESNGFCKKLNETNCQKESLKNEICYCGDDAKEIPHKKNGYVNALDEKPRLHCKKAKGMSANGYINQSGCRSCGQILTQRDKFDRGKVDHGRNPPESAEMCAKCASMNSEGINRRNRKKFAKPKEAHENFNPRSKNEPKKTKRHQFRQDPISKEDDDAELKLLKSMGWHRLDDENTLDPGLSHQGEACISEQEIREFQAKKKDLQNQREQLRERLRQQFQMMCIDSSGCFCNDRPVNAIKVNKS
eukprot:gene15591-6861_t